MHARLLKALFYCLLFIPFIAYSQWNQNASAGPFIYTDTSNWSGSVINDSFSIDPTNGLEVQFAGNYTTTGNLDFSYSNAANITLDSDSSGVSRTITLGGDILSSTSGGASITLGSDLIIDLNGSRTIDTPNSGNSIILDSRITGMGNLFFNSGTGDIYLNNDQNDFVGQVSASFVQSLYFSSIGNVGGGASAMGAPTSILEGTIQANNATSFLDLHYTGSSNSTTDRIIELNGSTGIVGLSNSGTGKLTFTSDIAHGVDNEHDLWFRPTSGEIEWSGIIQDAATQSLNIRHADSGRTTISGNNTYTGTTIIQSGTLVANNVNALGSTSGSTSITSTGTLQLTGLTITGEALTLSSSGSSSIGGLYSNSGSANAYTGNITMGGKGKIRIDSDGTSLDISGGVDLNGNELLLEADANTNSGSTLEVSGKITGSGSLTIVSGIGNVVLSNDTNDFDAAIKTGFVRNFKFSSIGNVGGGASALGAPTSISNGTISIENGGSFTVLEYTGSSDSSTDRIFDLKGTGTTILRTSGGGNLSISSNLAHSVDSNRTLKLETNSGDITWSGAITNPASQALSLEKTGSGTLTLSGNNTFSGGLLSTNGTLILSHNNSLGGVSGNGALSIGGTSINISNGVSISNGSLTITSNNPELKGIGTFARDLKIGNASDAITLIQPGNSSDPIGQLSLGGGGTSTLDENGTYVWNINDVSGSAGNDPGWSLLTFSGTLDIQADATNKFTIDINGYNGISLGAPANLSHANHDFEIIRASNITNFNENYFNFDSSDFLNGYGAWTIYQSGNSLYLRYAPVPEPSTWFVILSIGLFMTVRFSKKWYRKKV